MFRRILSVAALSLLLLAPPALAQKRQPRPQAAPPAAERQLTAVTPALFVARDADSEIYIFGTIHLRRPGSAWGGPAAQAALARADTVWTEILMGEGAEQALAQQMIRYGMAPRDRPLSTWLTPDQRTRLAAAARRMNVDPAILEPMRPWLAGLMLSVLPMVQAGYDPEAGVDQAVEEAAPTGARRRAFETAEQQLGFFSQLSPEAEVAFMMDAIDGIEEGVEDLNEMDGAWARGDLESLERMVVTDTRDQSPELYDVILVRRNHAWVETLMEELDGSGVQFVAVGAGHLLGEDGLVELLRARGVPVERVE